MKDGRLLYSCYILLLLAVLLMLSPPVAAEAAEQPQTVRVLLPLLSSYGYIMAEKDGTYHGYYMDYLQELEDHLGWRFQYIAANTEEELEEHLEKKDYDLIAGVQYAQNMDSQYWDYTRETIGAREFILATVKTHTSLERGNLRSVIGCRVAVTEETDVHKLEKRFKNYCYMNGIQYTDDDTRTYPYGINFVHMKEEDRYSALFSGEVDAILTSDADALEHGLYSITTFGMDSIYLAAPHKEAELLQKVDQAIIKIKSLDSEFENRQYQKYFSDLEKSKLSFLEKEENYLKQTHRFTVGLLSDFAPYSYYDKQGNLTGLVKQMFGQITGQSRGSLQFKFQVYANTKELLEALAAGEIDICGIAYNTPEMRKYDTFDQSRVYFNDKIQIFRYRYSEAEPSDAVIALRKDFSKSLTGGYVTEDRAVVEMDTAQDCLIQVNEGKADLTFLTETMANYYISYNQLDQLNISDVAMSNLSFFCLYGNTVATLAKTVMNKCMVHLDQVQLEETIQKALITEHKDVGVSDFVKTHLAMVTAIAFSVFFCIVLMLVTILYMVARNSKRIYRMLYVDEVTGERSYKKFMEECLRLLRNKEPPYCMLYLDVSNFKYINDVFGYEKGNDVLRKINHFMHFELKCTTYARIYADCFAGLYAYDTLESLENTLKEGMSAFEADCSVDFPEFNVYLKIGIYPLQEQTDMQTAVNLANYAVDQLKDASRSAYIFYSEEMHRQIVQQQEMEKDMYRAMEEGEFEAFYQPKFDVVTNTIIGAEALVRWNHKEKGMLAPGKFVPIFEKNLFIIEVDFYIFEKVCAFLAASKKEGNYLLPISCNFSRLHLYTEGFVDRLLETVERYGVETRYLEIEITETVATSDFEVFVNKMNLIKEKGFLISIDDFGSGYSSIQLLYKFPIDVLKFDKVFVDKMDAGEIEEELTRSIVNICHDHQIKVICEGVETKEQVDYVKSFHCRYVQGFLYSRPVPESEFHRMLLQENQTGA